MSHKTFRGNLSRVRKLAQSVPHNYGVNLKLFQIDSDCLGSGGPSWQQSIAMGRAFLWASNFPDTLSALLTHAGRNFCGT